MTVPNAVRARVKIDLRYQQAARELRDRYRQHVSSGAMVLESAGTYDVSRMLSTSPAIEPLGQQPNPARAA